MSNEDILKSDGFVWLSKHALWANRERRMAFRDQDVRDGRNARWIGDCLNSEVEEGWFRFYNSEEPPEACFKMLVEMGLLKLRPEKRFETFFVANSRD